MRRPDAALFSITLDLGQSGVRPPHSKEALYLLVLLADTTRMIASFDGPTLRVPTITGSDSRMLMSVETPVVS